MRSLRHSHSSPLVHCSRAKAKEDKSLKQNHQNQHLELRRLTQTELYVNEGKQIVGLITQENAALNQVYSKKLGTILTNAEPHHRSNLL